MLAAVGDYPAWWPQVRSVERVHDDVAAAVVRSVLPYTLRLVLTRQVQDEPHGLLRVGLGGDLRGWSQWIVRDAGDGTTLAEFTEEVTVGGALAVVARPGAGLMRLNHRAMMHGGERGLRTLLDVGRGAG